MKNYKNDDLTLDDPAGTGEGLEERARRAIENASTQELLALIRLQHALQTDMAATVETLESRSRRSH